MTHLLPHAYWSEIVQTLAAVSGFGISMWGIWDAWKDGQFWRGVLEEERALGRVNISTEARFGIARVHVWSEMASVVVQVTLLGVGISGLLLPPPDWYAPPTPELLGIAISRYGMTWIALVTSYKTVLRRYGRLSYIRQIRRADDGPGRVPMPSMMAPGHVYRRRSTDQKDGGGC